MFSLFLLLFVATACGTSNPGHHKAHDSAVSTSKRTPGRVRTSDEMRFIRNVLREKPEFERRVQELVERLKSEDRALMREIIHYRILSEHPQEKTISELAKQFQRGHQAVWNSEVTLRSAILREFGVSRDQLYEHSLEHNKNTARNRAPARRMKIQPLLEPQAVWFRQLPREVLKGLFRAKPGGPAHRTVIVTRILSESPISARRLMELTGIPVHRQNFWIRNELKRLEKLQRLVGGRTEFSSEEDFLLATMHGLRSTSVSGRSLNYGLDSWDRYLESKRGQPLPQDVFADYAKTEGIDRTEAVESYKIYLLY